MSKPKINEVDWMTATMVPVTRCEPPEGESCFLEKRPTPHYSAADARRHALEHPRHHVLRETVQRTSYLYTPVTEEG